MSLLNDWLDIARPTMIMLVATFFTGLFNYLFQIYMGRSLGTASYSELASLLSILYILVIPGEMVQSLMTRYVSKFGAQGAHGTISWLMRRGALGLLIFASAVFAIITLSGDLLRGFLSLSSVDSVGFLAIAVFLSLLIPAAAGPLQGLQRFLPLGGQSVSGALVKLLAGALLVGYGMGVNGALAGVSVGMGFALVLSVLFTRDYWLRSGEPAEKREIWLYVIPATMAVVCFTLLTNIDVVLVRHYFPEHEAGLYSAASMLAKVILFLPGAVVAVTFPKLSEAHTLNGSTSRLLRTGALSVLVLAGLVAAGYLVFSDPVILFLYGPEYAGAGLTLKILGFAMMFFGLANIFMVYGLATGSYSFVYLIGIVSIIEVIMIMSFHGSIEQVASILLGTGGLTTALSLAFVGIRKK